jgi:hypothetical protein
MGLLYLLLQLSCHSVAVVLTLVLTKRIKQIYIKETIQKRSTNSPKQCKCKYTYYQNTHTLQNKLKQPNYQIDTKWKIHNTIKYPQYKVTIMYMLLLSPRTSPWLTSLHNNRHVAVSAALRPITPHLHNRRIFVLAFPEAVPGRIFGPDTFLAPGGPTVCS